MSKILFLLVQDICNFVTLDIEFLPTCKWWQLCFLSAFQSAFFFIFKMNKILSKCFSSAPAEVRAQIGVFVCPKQKDFCCCWGKHDGLF